MRKKTFKLLINNPVRYKNKYCYDYSNSKGIELFVSKNSACIKVDMTTGKNLSEILYSKQNLFTDGIKKACLCQTLLYGQIMKIKMITLICNDIVMEKLEFDGEPIVYSIIDTKIQIPKNWFNKSDIEDVLFMPKTKQDSRVAALYAFLCAKSKTYESEKFMYYWMAINGIYNFLSTNVANNYQIKDGKMREIDQIALFCEYLGYKNEEIDKDDSKRIVRLVKNEIDNFSRKKKDVFKSDVFDEAFLNLVDKLLVKKDGTKYGVSPEAYLYLILPYTNRCELFHANKPIMLFSMFEEHEIVVMRVINNMLDSLIEKCLPELFGVKNMAICPRLKDTYFVKRLKERNLEKNK